MSLNENIKQYFIITGNYWAFTLTDGALRMLVILHFYQLGYSPLAIAMMFLFYEFFGVLTNLMGGWLGARIGLNRTMNTGLILQVGALLMLTVPTDYLTVAWVMAAQALSGIAKDLNKMSAKSAIKTLLPDNASNKLYKWTAILTGSKNTLKGVGFFLGGALLYSLGFQYAMVAMATALGLVWVISICCLKKELGKSKIKPKLQNVLSKSRTINILSAARLFLFGARDVWFVVALPVFLSVAFGWSHLAVGGFLACWVIGYGIVQAFAPVITKRYSLNVSVWGYLLAAIPALIALALQNNINPELTLITGLVFFGILFALNSSLHSYLIVSCASKDSVSLDVGFYYMANAMGRLIGTVLSGWVFQQAGLEACLWISSSFVIISAMLAGKLRIKSA